MLLFFHNTDEYREEFTHRGDGRPCFYWFCDRFHTHIGNKIPLMGMFKGIINKKSLAGDAAKLGF
jgi:hypothetical protein